MEYIKESALITSILYDKAMHFQKHFIFPTQQTWCKWIYQYGGRSISRRSINRWFALLESRGIIKRISRTSSDKNGGLQFASTLYALGFNGIQLLFRIGRISWAELKAYISNSSKFARRRKKESLPASSGFSSASSRNPKSLKDILSGVMIRGV